MRFAIDMPNFGVFSDARLLAQLAYEAEESGWDGFFIWDHINYRPPIYKGSGAIDQPASSSPEPLEIADPWIGLTAIALRTKTLKIGPMVTPLPRRRPWKLAREAVTLDQLSEGRLILGVGIGGDRSGEYSATGEVPDARIHGEMLDEGLEILTRLWSGEEFSYQGNHYHFSQVRSLPKPLQNPRIPIWVAGFWPNKKPFRRAARWDGVFPLISGRELPPDEFRKLVGYIQEIQVPRQTSALPFEIIASGQTDGGERAMDTAIVSEFARIGATWWLECFYPQNTLEQVRQRIHQGPPQVK